MLEYSKLPDRQGRPAQKQQLYTAPAAYGVSRTNIRSNFRSDQDERYHPVQCIPQQSLFYGADISWSSDNAAAAPIQMLTIPNDDEDMEFDDLEQYMQYLEGLELATDSAVGRFFIEIYELRNVFDFRNISIKKLQYNEGTTFADIKELIRNYLDSHPWGSIKQLVKMGCFSDYAHDPKEFFLNQIEKKFQNSYALVLAFLRKNFDVYFQFGQALVHHAVMRRVDHGSEIKTTDIQHNFNAGTACAISALMYAEGSIFGTSDVETFHYMLMDYFNSYPGYTREDNENVKNTVWRNYSYDVVYPSMYAFFGYNKQNSQDRLINVYKEPDRYGLTGKRGIIIIDEPKTGESDDSDDENSGHAIGFRCTSNGIMTLQDNESTDSDQQFLNSHQMKVVSAIYAKKL